MNRMEAIAWVMSLCTELRLSQTKTLAELVGAALSVGRMTLSAIGRRLTGETTTKARIQKTWRFTSNTRVVVSDAMQGVIRWLCSRKRFRKKPLLVAFDWTEIRQFHTLMAAAVMNGRAVPLLWASYPEWVLSKSQNNLEEGLLRLLKSMLPEGVKVVLLADRGFGRTELARTCQHIGIHYVVRVKADVWVDCPEHRGKLLDFKVKKGMCCMLRNVAFRKKDPVRQNVVVRWKENLPKKRDEPWFLMTDLQRPPLALSELYGKRMTIEELFRDDKNRRNGWALRNTKITKADRIDRLLLILALTYILLLGIGLIARQRYRPSMWCSSNDPRQCSVFTIGRTMLTQMEVQAALAIAAVVHAIETASKKWG
jgi:DDE family transposase